MHQDFIEQLQYIRNRVEDQRNTVDIRPGLLMELRLEREDRERQEQAVEWEARRRMKWNVISGLMAAVMLLGMAVWGGMVIQRDFDVISTSVSG